LPVLGLFRKLVRVWTGRGTFERLAVPVMNKRTYVGLDVHARSLKGCAIDYGTGEIVRQGLAANHAGTVEWVSGLPSPALVGYEAGPTLGIHRALPP
jgi:hypothetical protein